MSDTEKFQCDRCGEPITLLDAWVRISFRDWVCWSCYEKARMSQNIHERVWGFQE